MLGDMGYNEKWSRDRVWLVGAILYWLVEEGFFVKGGIWEL